MARLFFQSGMDSPRSAIFLGFLTLGWIWGEVRQRLGIEWELG